MADDIPDSLECINLKMNATTDDVCCLFTYFQRMVTNQYGVYFDFAKPKVVERSNPRETLDISHTW